VPIAGWLTFKRKLVDLDEPIAGWESWWDDDDGESVRARIGTGAALGNVMKQPTVRSHLPTQPDFASFPTNIDVCLQDDSPLPDVPPPCEADPPSTTLPQANVCFLVKEDHPFPVNVCSDISGYTATYSHPDLLTMYRRRMCIAQALTAACAPTRAYDVDSDGLDVVSHIIDATIPPSFDFMDECVQGFGTAWVEQHLGFAACDDTAALYLPGDVIDPDPFFDNDVPPIEPGACR
jgi:hypothetical protein